MKFEIQVQSKQRAEFVDIKSEVQSCVQKSGVQNGVCVLFVPHTSAGLAVIEDWDPLVKADILAVLERLVPWEAGYHHTAANAAAHIKSCLVGTSETLLVEAGKLVLGTWQGVFFAEFDGPRRRRVLVRVTPDVEGA